MINDSFLTTKYTSFSVTKYKPRSTSMNDTSATMLDSRKK